MVYVLQPPPELPCNPFIRDEGKDYGNVVLDCYVAVSRVFLKKIDANIDIRFYANLTGSISIHRGNLERIDRGDYDYIVLLNALFVERLDERDEYWCQVLRILMDQLRFSVAQLLSLDCQVITNTSLFVLGLFLWDIHIPWTHSLQHYQ